MMEINTENVIKESDLKEIAEYVKSKLISLGQKTAKVSISVSENLKDESSEYTTQKLKTEPIRISTTNGVMCLYNFIN
jgi:predicted RNA-binding protein